MAPATKSKAEIKTEKLSPMAQLVQDVGTGIVPFHQGDVINVEVITATRSKIVVNVMDLAMGFIPAREFSTDPRELKPGDKIPAYVVSIENEDGWVVLSMRRADRERVWGALSDKMKSGDEVEVRIRDANRGGLLVEYSGAEGFIPVSQLGQELNQRGKEVNTRALKELIGKPLMVKVITVDHKQNKLIFSQRAAELTKTKEKMGGFTIGQHLTGKVTGIVDFGLFVDLGGLEGLVHISEVSWDRIDNLKDRYKTGDEVEVEVIAIEGGKVSLSMKRLLPDPWLEAVADLEIGGQIEGEVTKTTQFGAFVKLKEGVQGLAHISELGENIKNTEDIVKAGQSYQFRILSIDPLQHKISLSYRSAEPEMPVEPAVSKKTAAKKSKVRSKKSE